MRPVLAVLKNWVYHTAVIIWTQHGPVTGNERDSSWNLPDARLHTTETEAEAETAAPLEPLTELLRLGGAP